MQQKQTQTNRTFSFSYYCYPYGYQQAFLTFSALSFHHRAENKQNNNNKNTVINVCRSQLHGGHYEEPTVGTSNPHSCHCITLCGCACMRKSQHSCKRYITMEEGWERPLGMLNELCVMCLHFDCDPSQEMRCEYFTCGFMLLLEKFWILVHLDFGFLPQRCPICTFTSSFPLWKTSFPFS